MSLPIDVIDVLHESLRAERRPEDGLLHCSSDLLGSLRHAQLRIAGAPTLTSELLSDVTLKTGTMWHEYVGRVLQGKGIPVVQELSVTPWLPNGWAGTADYLFFDPEYQAWVLADLKTMKGEGIRFVRKDGAKQEHIWQVSAYYHALVEGGFEILDRFSIIYLPKNDTPDKNDEVAPVVAECTPLPKVVVWEEMLSRWEAVEAYQEELETYSDEAPLVNEYLADPMPRVQKYWWNSKTETFEVKLVPHWSAAYCPYDDSLCDCSSQGSTKIGEWTMGGYRIPDSEFDEPWYEARKGYEDIEVEVKPTLKEIKKRYG